VDSKDKEQIKKREKRKISVGHGITQQKSRLERRDEKKRTQKRKTVDADAQSKTDTHTHTGAHWRILAARQKKHRAREHSKNKSC
jgi:hypothetical protein